MSEGNPRDAFADCGDRAFSLKVDDCPSCFAGHADLLMSGAGACARALLLSASKKDCDKADLRDGLRVVVLAVELARAYAKHASEERKEGETA